MSKIDVSVIVPIFNSELYLRECIDSALNQKNVSTEIICVDDGSSDDSAAIIDYYKDLYPNIKKISKENGGQSSARNAALKIASGQYIYFLDSDDKLYSDDCLEYAIDRMKKKDLDILYMDGDSFFTNEKLRHIYTNYSNLYMRKKEYGFFPSGLELFCELMKSGEFKSSVCLQVYSADFIKQNRLEFCEGVFYEDNLFSLQSILVAKKVEHTKKLILNRRVREGSTIFKKKDFKDFYSAYTIWKKLQDTMKENVSLITEKEELYVETFIESMKTTVNNLYLKMPSSKRRRIINMPWEERYDIKNCFDKSVKEDFLYVFPYYLFERNDRVVIYGAGNIGQTIYRQAKQYGFACIEGVVDMNSDIIEAPDINVNSILELTNLEFDYLLIAIENEKIASNAIKTVIELGVEEKKIVWLGKGYSFKEFINCSREWYKNGCGKRHE